MNGKTRKAFEETRKKDCGLYLSGADKLKYFERLIKPYDKKERKVFITQYLSADGNELNHKFWSINSSSRFAFELYSWMANDPEVLDFEFEKKLYNIKGSPKKPNMDVYIEKKDTIIFIESKFSEHSPQNIEKLSDSYYLPKGESKNSKSEIIERYYNLENFAKEIPAFIKKVYKVLSQHYDSCWMDYKQEITHLIGIALTVIKNPQIYRNKIIKFLNVYYDFEDKTDSPFEWFFEEGESLLKGLLKNHCKSFTYRYISAQEMVKGSEVAIFKKNTIAFGTENATIGEILKKQFNFELK